MAQNRSRFVLLCQQTLACAVVAAVAAPAASLVSLDIVAAPPPTPTPGPSPANASSVVAAAPVRPTVSTVPLRGVSRAGLRALRDQPAGAPTGAGARLVSATVSPDLTVLSAPQPVDGLATVGVTWGEGVHVADRAIRIAVRTETRGAWSAWTRVPYKDDEGPDPTSTEGRQASPGTDPVYVGAVDRVQVRAVTSSGRVPAGMRLSLVDPGTTSVSKPEGPAIDTSRLHLLAAEQVTAASAKVTGKPVIYSRAQWGADERMRQRSALHYGEVHGGFVHHTVNANYYTRAQVPAIIRGIYAYHTQSRGWSDVGYNFLVDRFGRIWEGRAGGVDRPVVGAHTLGYNDDAFAMSAIGNFDVKRPSGAIVRAFGRLFAWKLSLHGVAASSPRQWIEQRYLPAVNGHRDVGQTACPGRYLYTRIPRIRRLAAREQVSWAARQRTASIAGSTRPAVVARDAATKRAYLIRSTAAGAAGPVTDTGRSFKVADKVLNVGDWTGDGVGDVVTRSSLTGLLHLFRGTSSGHLAKPVLMGRRSFARVRLLAAVGDMTGDGHPDLMGQPVGGSMRLYPGDGATGLSHGYVAHAAITAGAQVGVGLWTADGAPDSVLRRTDGTLVLYPGNGPGGLTGGRTIGRAGHRYDWLLAGGDLTGDGHPDLVARARATGRLWVLPGTSTGFTHRRAFAGDMHRFDLAD